MNESEKLAKDDYPGIGSNYNNNSYNMMPSIVSGDRHSRYLIDDNK